MNNTKAIFKMSEKDSIECIYSDNRQEIDIKLTGEFAYQDYSLFKNFIVGIEKGTIKVIRIDITQLEFSNSGLVAVFSFLILDQALDAEIIILPSEETAHHRAFKQMISMQKKLAAKHRKPI